jgi:hypothetical protein
MACTDSPRPRPTARRGRPKPSADVRPRFTDQQPRGQLRQRQSRQHQHQQRPGDPHSQLSAAKPAAPPRHNPPGEHPPTFQRLTSSIQPRPQAVGCNASLGLLRSGFIGPATRQAASPSADHPPRTPLDHREPTTSTNARGPPRAPSTRQPRPSFSTSTAPIRRPQRAARQSRYTQAPGRLRAA